MYATIENIDKIKYNKGLNKIELLGDNNTITLESLEYSTEELAKELLGMAMQIIYEMSDEDGMKQAIGEELSRR